jgi:four helix bundle protein
MNSSQLLDRLIEFAALIIKLTASVKRNRAGMTLIDQMTRSGISSALNYGEASGAESPKDFIHKIQLVLKELRETWVALRITEIASLASDNEILNRSLEECNQLISIFTKSVKTSKSKIIPKRRAEL